MNWIFVVALPSYPVIFVHKHFCVCL